MNVYIVYILIRQLYFKKRTSFWSILLWTGTYRNWSWGVIPRNLKSSTVEGVFGCPDGAGENRGVEGRRRTESAKVKDQIIQIKNRVYQEHIHSLKIRSNICARWSICTKYNPTLPPTVFCTQCHCILYVIFVFVGAYVWKRWHFQICFCP